MTRVFSAAHNNVERNVESIIQLSNASDRLHIGVVKNFTKIMLQLFCLFVFGATVPNGSGSPHS